GSNNRHIGQLLGFVAGFVPRECVATKHSTFDDCSCCQFRAQWRPLGKHEGNACRSVARAAYSSCSSASEALSSEHAVLADTHDGQLLRPRAIGNVRSDKRSFFPSALV